MSWYYSKTYKVTTRETFAPAVGGADSIPPHGTKWKFFSLTTTTGTGTGHATKPSPSITYGLLFSYRQYLARSNTMTFKLYKNLTGTIYKAYITALLCRIYKYNGSTFTLLHTFTLPHPSIITHTYTVGTTYSLTKYTLATTTRLYLDIIGKWHSYTSGYSSSFSLTKATPFQIGTQLTSNSTSTPISPQLFFVRGTST